MNVELEMPFDPELLMGFSGATEFETEKPYDIAEGATVTVLSPKLTRSFDAQQFVPILIKISGDVAVGIVASWLYDKLKAAAALRFKGKPIEISPEALRRIFEAERNRER